jgi:peptidoglycan/LPS O-acetylase OafA/YrhL
MPSNNAGPASLHTHVHYRPDVDGLRAVAVLLVLMYHAQLGFPGGFLGVDVFFVISGYLITGRMLRDLAEGRFSLGQFWLRRIRRILPASLLMLVTVLAFGGFLLLPADLMELCESAAAHLLFSANFFFWKQSGYFDGSVDLKPLLHFWSLAVEEQFYLLFPLYLLLLPPLNRSGRLAWLALTGICTLAGFYGHLRHPSAAFYLLPCRAWELLLGGTLCLIPASFRPSQRVNLLLGLLGIGSIVLSGCVAQNHWSRWFPPGLIPCLGAVAVIVSGREATSPVCRLLSSRLFVSIGLISYSLYLWHWPLLSFLRHLETDLQFEAGGIFPRILCLAVSAMLAAISYHFIEQPIRRRRVLSSSRQLLTATGVATAFCLGICSTVVLFNGIPQRFDQQVLRYARAAEENAGRFARSMTATDVQNGDLYACGPRTASKKFLLFGDSHAMCLLPGLEPLAEFHGIRIDQATRFATAPLEEFDHLAIWRNEGATEFCEATLQLIERSEYDCVMLMAAWEGYVQWPSFTAAFRKTLERLQQRGIPVVLILPIPDQRIDVPMHLAGAIRRGHDVQVVGVTSDERENRIRPLTELLKTCNSPLLHVIDPTPALAGPNGLIRAELDGEALYSDHQHLSSAGRHRVADRIILELRRTITD